MTTDEKKEIKQAVLDEIKAESNDITEIETVSTLDGLTGLPAMQGEKLVTAPLSLLSKPATDAAATANAAADTANKAADTANKAAQTATNAAATANKAASMISTYDDRINLAMNGASARFDGFVEGVIIEYLSVMSIDGVYYDIKNKRFCAKKDGHYYNNWVIGDNTHAASMYLDDGRRIPRKDKMYVCGTNLYVWSDEEGNLVVVDKTTKELGTWLITHDNVTTIDALNQELDAFDAKTAQGLHHVKCWGIPLFVTLSVLNVDKKVLMQTITGSITLNADNTALGSISGTENYSIAVRYYQNSKWGKWSMPLNPPTAQTGPSGTKTSYIYSAGSDQDTKTLVTSKFWIYKHSNFNLFLRFKHWGANNDEAEENYSQVQLPNAWTQSNGLLRRDIYARLDAFELREQNSTATEVKIVTPIFTTGGTRELSISQATTAKAGVMTAADKAQLDVIAASMDSFGNSITEQAKRIYDLEQCKPLATKSRNGFMSSEDKTQLQGAYADFNARQQANDVEGYVGRSNVISVPGTVENTQIAADFYRNAEERDYTPGDSFDVYVSSGYDENNPNKQCVWFGLHIEPTLYVRYRLDYWLHGTADTLVGKYLCDTSDKYYEVREGAVGEYISEALDDTPCIMTIADRRLLNKIKQKLGL